MMDTVIELSWRVYPAAVLMAVGLAVAFLGVGRGFAGIRQRVRDASHPVSVMRGFRVAVIGLALAGIGAAWLWHLTWLLILALVIGGEETLEATLIIFALTRGSRMRLGFSTGRPVTPSDRAAR